MGFVEQSEEENQKQQNNTSKQTNSNTSNAAYYHSFYELKLQEGGIFKDIIIDRDKMLSLLKDHGFYRYETSPSNRTYIRIVNKVVRKVDITQITDWWFDDYLANIPEYEKPTYFGGEACNYRVTKHELRNKFLKSISSYFSEGLLNRLTSKQEIIFNRDTRQTKFIYYQNGFIKITREGIQFEPDYNLLTFYVWKDKILDRHYNASLQARYHEGEFYRFCLNVSGKITRLYSLQTIIGYLMHDFFDGKLKGIILTDSKISESGEANGRTGKGVFAKGIGYMLNGSNLHDATVFCQINGKGFDPQNKHRYQRASSSTLVIHLEDLKAYTDYETFFNDITESVEVDKKNEQPFRIWAKFLFTINKTLRIKGDSMEDRAVQFEFTEHYSKDFSPEQEFGHWLFTDWSEAEWQLFDAFMINSIFTYFKNNLQIDTPETINLGRRSLIDHTSEEFVGFMDYYGFTDEHHKMSTPKGYLLVPDGQGEKEYNKRDLFNEFIGSYPSKNTRRFSQSKFTKWVRIYSETSNQLQTIVPERDERRSGGQDYIILRRQTL